MKEADVIDARAEDWLVSGALSHVLDICSIY